MSLGAHVSAAGGIDKAIDRAVAIGAECIQLFVSSPQRWMLPAHTEGEVARFRERRAHADISPVFIHTIYLLNLVSSANLLRSRSLESLSAAMSWAEVLGARGVVTHLGSEMGRPDAEAEEAVAEAVMTVLNMVPGKSLLLLETSAGATVGRDFAQLGRIVHHLPQQVRLGVCLDTAHVFAAGYDLSTEAGLGSMLDEFQREIGLTRLAVVHANDSKSPLGSHRDRHENIGQGMLGEEAFARMLHDPMLCDLPFILEVPGTEGTGPDRANLAVMRRLAGRED